MTDSRDTEVDPAWEQWQRSLSPAARAVQARVGPRPNYPPPAYWLIVWDSEAQNPKITSFNRLVDLTEEIRKLPVTSVGIPVLGHVLRTTEPAGDTTCRYLVLPDGDTVPLFKADGDVRLSAELFFARQDSLLPPWPDKDTSTPPRAANEDDPPEEGSTLEDPDERPRESDDDYEEV